MEMKNKHSIFICIVFSLIIAALDEINQLFIPGRGASLSDGLIDCIGISLGICVSVLAAYLVRRNGEQ